MTLISWRPLHTMRALDDPIKSQFDRLLGSVFSDTSLGRVSAPMDVSSSGDDLVVRLDLPGIDAERDVDVSVEDDMLYISGERSSSAERSDEKVYIRETTWGSFCRTLPLPKNVHAEDVSAEYTDGVLTVRVKGGAAPIGSRAHRVAIRSSGREQLGGESHIEEAAPEAEVAPKE